MLHGVEACTVVGDWRGQRWREQCSTCFVIKQGVGDVRHHVARDDERNGGGSGSIIAGKMSSEEEQEWKCRGH